MNIIVAVDKNWGIGRDNDLLFYLPQDLMYFKQKTLNKVVVMGGNTLLSLPNSRPLPNRTSLVLSDVFTRDDCRVFATLNQLLQALKEYKSEDIFIIGGAMFYKTMLEYCDTAYVTRVDADGRPDCYFPCLDKMDNWILTKESPTQISNGFEIKYTIYKNKNPKFID